MLIVALIATLFIWMAVSDSMPRVGYKQGFLRIAVIHVAQTVLLVIGGYIEVAIVTGLLAVISALSAFDTIP